MRITPFFNIFATMEVKLEDISIDKYAKLLRTGSNAALIAAIDTELSKALNGSNTGMDLALFMLQKDLLIFQCKAAQAYFNRDNEKFEQFNKKITELSEQIKKKTFKKEKANPYESFLSWLQAVEKYIGFAIDKNNDLLYFVIATKQMLNHYDQLDKK